MQAPPDALATVTALTVAVIAGLVAFIVAVLSKDQKTSEFRQAWIDALRSDIADFAAMNLTFFHAIQIQANRPDADNELGEHILRERVPEMVGIETTRARILLRLNRNEHQKLIQLVNNVYGKSEVVKPDSHETLILRVEALISESQNVLKTEWRRVKTGEPIFIVTKWFSLVLASLALVGAIYYVSGRWQLIYVA